MQKYLKNYLRLVIVGVFVSVNLMVADAGLKHYYCTPSDERHFPLLMNLRIMKVSHVRTSFSNIDFNASDIHKFWARL